MLEAISKQMPDDGFLFLGGAETVLGISDRFRPVPAQRGIYCVNRGVGATQSSPLSAGLKV